MASSVQIPKKNLKGKGKYGCCFSSHFSIKCWLCHKKSAVLSINQGLLKYNTFPLQIQPQLKCRARRADL